VGVDDVEERGLEGGTAHQEAVDVGARGQSVAVLGAHTATVDNPGALGDRLPFGSSKILPQALVRLLGLGGGAADSGANGPNRLICNHNTAPITMADDGLKGLELTLIDGVALS